MPLSFSPLLWRSAWCLPVFRVSTAADQKASWEGKGLFCLHFHVAVHHQRKSGLELKQVRKQELMQWPWRDVLYWLASPGLLSLLSYRTKTANPEMVPPTRGLSPLITNWENALQLDLMEAFLQLKLLSLWQLQLCQLDTKLASTIDPLSTWHTNTSLVSLNPCILIHPQDLNNFKSPTVFTYIKFNPFKISSIF
jgi:hypothetical protein